VQGKSLNGIDIDMNSISDTVMTLGVVACFAQGPTTIRNVGHIRHKETDRISALANELGKIGAHVTTNEDGLVITPPCPGQALHGARIHTYDDHRMAMAFAPVAMQKEITLLDPSVVNKSYPSFWKHISILLNSEQ
jgi:3-phosphoshikimate 1-carboxyvinyltransferase